MYQDDLFFALVNKNHKVREAMDRVEAELPYSQLAHRLSQISARRKKK